MEGMARKDVWPLGTRQFPSVAGSVPGEGSIVDASMPQIQFHGLGCLNFTLLQIAIPVPDQPSPHVWVARGL
jgi:hypothetical protein